MRIQHCVIQGDECPYICALGVPDFALEDSGHAEKATLHADGSMLVEWQAQGSKVVKRRFI